MTHVRLTGMLSGGGRTLLNLLDAIDAGHLDASMPHAISSRADAPGAERLRARGVTVDTVCVRTLPVEEERHDAIDRLLAAHAPDLVVLGGWLRWVRVPDAFAHRMINIHPSLLPEFGGKGMHGLHVHAAVLAARRQVSGCTVHMVDPLYDHGAVIVQRGCPVLEGDTPETLAARVFRQECIAYPEAIRLLSRCVHSQGV